MHVTVKVIVIPLSMVLWHCTALPNAAQLTQVLLMEVDSLRA